MRIGTELRALRLPRFGASRDVAEAHLPTPERPIYAVGDVHGRADLLTFALRKIQHDALTYQLDGFEVVFLGDYIDRGYGPAKVLSMVHRLATRNPGWVTCLMGNHEQMMLDFLASPEETGAEWLRHGGQSTLESFGISIPHKDLSGDQFRALADELDRRLPDEMKAWLTDLPLLHQSGNVAFVHAGVDPTRAVDDQDRKHLLWGHPTFLSSTRQDDAWVVHGHTIVRDAAVADGRISVDTGAYATGRLSAVLILPDGSTRILST